MFEMLLKGLETLFMASNDSQLVTHMAHVLLTFSVLLAACTILIGPAPYGRYAWKASGWRIPQDISWFLQECPSFLLPLGILLFSSCSSSTINKLLLGCFMLHYAMRSFIYSVQLGNGTPSEWYLTAPAFLYCSYNGFMQSYYLLCLAEYPASYYQSINFVLGVLLFFCGIAINIHSDNIITHLRKPGETDYKIPRGGLFEYVSCANYFGEIMEWCGFALATLSYPAFSFAVSTALFLGMRALDHHRFYLKKFENYPRSRKAVIPFIL